VVNQKLKRNMILNDTILVAPMEYLFVYIYQNCADICLDKRMF